MRACPHCRAVYQRHVGHCGLDGTPLIDTDQDPALGLDIGPYHLEALLGAGAMGRVYRVRHRRLGTALALKLLHGDHAADREVIARLRREAAALGALRHPHIISVVDAGTTEAGLAYLVMELATGRTLDEALRAGPFSLERAKRVASQIASALAEAHAQGFVHRDLKPHNVFLAQHAAGESAKVLDFGLVQIVGADEAESLTRSGITFGTPAYMAPEQAVTTAVGPAADVYALGVITFEMIDGERPFGGEVTEILARKALAHAPPCRAPASVQELVAGMLEREPSLRPTATQVHSQLSRDDAPVADPSAATVMPSPAPGASTSPPPPRRWPVVALLAAAALTALFAFMGPTATRSPELSRTTSGGRSGPVRPPEKMGWLPIRFVALHACSEPGAADCPRLIDERSSFELAEVANSVFTPAGLHPYVASVEHVVASSLTDPNRTASWSQVQGDLLDVQPALEDWIPPSPRTVREWLEAASTCAGHPADVLVWVWEGPTRVSTPQQGRFMFMNSEELRDDPTLLAALMAEQMGKPLGARPKGDGPWPDPWAGAPAEAWMDDGAIEAAEQWFGGARSPDLPPGHPCSALDRRYRVERLDDRFLWSNGDLAFELERFPLGVSDYVLAVGDFDGNGYDDLLLYQPGPKYDVIHHFGAERSRDHTPVRINGRYVPVVGDFDGNGRDDVLWHEGRPEAEQAAVWWSRSSTTTFVPGKLAIVPAHEPVAGDFDGDGDSDLLWYRDGAIVQITWSDPRTAVTRAVERAARGTPLVGDFDGNHTDDIFWYRPGDGRDEVWRGQPDGRFLVERSDVQVQGTYDPLVGDFDGDGYDDILWNQEARRTGVWRGRPDGGFARTRIVVAGRWTMVAGDFDADGDDDLFLYEMDTAAPGTE